MKSVLRPLDGERLNTATHGAGTLLSLAGAAVMLDAVLAVGDGWRLAGCLVYLFALVGVYANSTLSHSASTPRVKRMFRQLDQAFIYLLIVGTYTPFALAYLRTPAWLAFLTLLWLIAIFGFLSKVLRAHRVEQVAVWIYLTLGWLPILSTGPLLERAPLEGLTWMLIGGLCYTAGTIFLTNDHRVPHFHAVWHLFVIAGSACHFHAILQSVARGL